MSREEENVERGQHVETDFDPNRSPRDAWITAVDRAFLDCECGDVIRHLLDVHEDYAANLRTLNHC